jgi:glutamyl-tRNA reductase
MNSKFAVRKMEGQNKEISLKAVHLSHLETPVEIRERFAFDDSQSRQFLLTLRDLFHIQEAFLLSTCNRTELYYYHETDPQEIIRAIAAFKSISSETAQQYFRISGITSESVHHLFRVGIGLESSVLGDFQIINQVKTAYQITADLEMAGPFLHRLLHSVFFLNKRIVQETSFRSGSASVSYATKELAEDLLTDKSKPVTVIGLGEIGISVIKNLIENGFTNLNICNRSQEKAAELLSDTVRFVPFSEWESTVRDSALVISALSGDHLQIKTHHVADGTVSGYQYFIDLGMPRSIDPAIENNPKAILYNIDQIQSKVSEALTIRKAAVPQVEQIVSEGKEEFMEWSKEMLVSPVIQQMKTSLEQIRKEEMSRFLKKAGEEQAEWAEELTKNLMQRIMKTHVVQLKAACKRGDAEELVEVLQQLFTVEESSKA